MCVCVCVCIYDNTRSDQIYQKQDDIRHMCSFPGYYQNGFVATQALRQRCMRCTVNFFIVYKDLLAILYVCIKELF